MAQWEQTDDSPTYKTWAEKNNKQHHTTVKTEEGKWHAFSGRGFEDRQGHNVMYSGKSKAQALKHAKRYMASDSRRKISYSTKKMPRNIFAMDRISFGLRR